MGKVNGPADEWTYGDLEAGGRALEARFALIREHAKQVQEAVDMATTELAGLRARAEKDAGKLERVTQALKLLQE